MNLGTKALVHILAGALTLLCLELSTLPVLAQQAEPQDQQSAAAVTATSDQAAPNGQRSSAPNQPADQQGSSQATESQPDAPIPSPEPIPQQPQATTPPQKPVGTAAAESPNVSGIAASQPAGVAIAPAKQRRARILVLKIGALVAAGVAVGTVAALTRGTPSKPPGAH
jgi:hypothetical protein